MTDPYVDPETGVLRNLWGITDPVALKAAEADLTLAVITALATERLPGEYDLEHLRAFHRRIFGRLYPWAGEIRTVAIAKTDMFCLPQFIEPYANDVFLHLAMEKHLRGLPREAFVDRLTHYLAEVNAIHPFREGNGRTQRAFFFQLSQDAGWPVDWSRLDRDENIDASIAALRGDHGPLRAMLDRLVAPDSEDG
ncbi:MAG: Fic family protein [Micromonosporaceae bacterium]|nr:Fic family protein [Micromonosporaceae bacterium]